MSGIWNSLGARRFVLIASAFWLAASMIVPLAADEPAQHVRLTIDYGDGVQKVFVALAWKEKLTVFGALQAAEKHPRGIKVSHTGNGATIFITAIDDQANEGPGGNNWRYTVNDKSVPSSAGVAELKAGDAIVWRFGR